MKVLLRKVLFLAQLMAVVALQGTFDDDPWESTNHAEQRAEEHSLQRRRNRPNLTIDANNLVPARDDGSWPGHPARRRTRYSQISPESPRYTVLTGVIVVASLSLVCAYAIKGFVDSVWKS